MTLSIVAKIRNSFHEHGFFEFFIFIFTKLVRKFIYKRQSIVFLKRELSLKTRKYRASKRWHEREFTRDDIPLCDKHFKQFKSDYNDLFDLNLKSFAAFESGTENVIAIVWYSEDDFYDQHYLHQTFTISDNQVFQFAGEVSEPYRNTQISATVVKFAWEYWESKGKKELVTTVDTKNSPSIRYVFHLGWEEMGKIQHFHQLLGCRWQRMEHYKNDKFSQFKKRKKTITQ